MAGIQYEAFRSKSCLDAALNYLKFGWSMLGCCPPDHFGVGEAHKKNCSHPGKAPWGPWKVYQDRLPTEGEITTKFNDNPRLNVGVCLGPVSGIIRVDVDGQEGEAKLAEISGGDLPPTLEFISGRANGGRGLLYAIPNGVVLKTTPLKTGEKQTELRFQARGAQTILPPSLHSSGCRYQWVSGRGPGEIEIAVMPTWALEALKPAEPRTARRRWGPTATTASHYVEAAVRAELTVLCETIEGGRNDQLNKSSFVLGQFVGAGVLGRAEIERILLAAAVDIGLSPEEAAATIRSGLESGAAKPRDLTGTGRRGPLPLPSINGALHPPTPNNLPTGGEAPFTDIANGRRLAIRHGQDIRFCYPWRAWLHWTGQRWSLDQTGAAMRLAKDSVIQLLHSVHRELDEAIQKAHSSGAKPQLDQIEEMLEWAEKSHDIARLNAMLDLAKSEEGISVLPDHLDRNGWLLNCRNGTIDLRTGQLRKHYRDDLLTKLVPVDYDPTATAPTWKKFLNRIFDGNYDLIEYLKRAVGYSLTGHVSEQCLFFLYGDGANGKSTFIGAVQHVMGDYALQAVSDLLLAKKEQHPTERADLFGRRFVATIEVDDGKKLAEALMKQLTGGDKIRARFMRKDFFEFDPTHKIFLAANHRPIIRGTDHANWRRIKLVPFSVTIPDEERDPHLLDKLKDEAPGILHWMVEGCRAWNAGGLGEPDEVRQATAEYRAEQDVVGRFLQERCCTGPDYRIRASDLYRAFTTWCQNGGDGIEMTQTAFGRALTAKHFERDTSNGVWYIGLALRHD